MPIYVLNEAKEAPLYHCTSVRSAISILKSGELRPTIPYNDQNVPTNVQGKSCVCFTRSERYVLDRTYYVQFVFDQGKLVNNYKVKSVVNRRYNAQGIDYGTQDPENADNFEHEERVMTNKPIPIDKYLLDIRLVANDVSRSDVTRMLKDGYYGDRDMYQLYTMAKTSDLPLGGILKEIERIRVELAEQGVRMDIQEPKQVENPGTSLIPKLDYEYDTEFTQYTEDGKPVFAEKPSDYSSVVFFKPSIYSILTKEGKIPYMTLDQLKPYIHEVRLMDGRMDPDRVADALKKIRDNNITDPDDADRFAENSSEGFLMADLVMIDQLGLPCSSVNQISPHDTEDSNVPTDVAVELPDDEVSVDDPEDTGLDTNPGVQGKEFSQEDALVPNEPKKYHSDIAGVRSVTSDRVTVEFNDGVVAEFKIAMNTVTGVIVRRPGKKAQVYGGTKAIPPYYKKLIASGVVMEIYNDMFQEEVVEPIDMEDDNVRFYVSFEGRDVVIEAEILVNNLVKYDLVRDYLVNALGMDDDFVKRTTTVSAPSRDLWIGRINSYFKQIQAKIDNYVPVVDKARDTVGLVMLGLIKPKGFNIIKVNDDSINAEIKVRNAKITVDMDAHDADIYIAGIKLSDYPDLVADMDNAGYTNIREYTDESVKIMESISKEEDTEEFAIRISELLDMITNGVANAPAKAKEPEPKDEIANTRALSPGELHSIQSSAKDEGFEVDNVDSREVLCTKKLPENMEMGLSIRITPGYARIEVEKLGMEFNSMVKERLEYNNQGYRFEWKGHSMVCEIHNDQPWTMAWAKKVFTAGRIAYDVVKTVSEFEESESSPDKPEFTTVDRVSDPVDNPEGGVEVPRNIEPGKTYVPAPEMGTKYLYHCTTLESAYQILQSDTLITGDFGVCFTRDGNYFAPTTEVQLTFDRNKVKRATTLWAVLTDGVDTEAEERSVKDISNIKSMMLSVDINKSLVSDMIYLVNEFMDRGEDIDTAIENPDDYEGIVEDDLYYLIQLLNKSQGIKVGPNLGKICESIGYEGSPILSKTYDNPDDAIEISSTSIKPTDIEEPTEVLDDTEEFLRVMSNRRDFKEVNDYKFRYVESDDNYDFEVEFDNEYDVVYFIVHCADVKDTEFINRVMGNAYKFSGYTGQSVMTVQMDLGDLNKMIDTQVKKFNILVDETLAQSQAKSAHAISAELVAKPQQDPEQERAAKRLEKFVRTVLAPIVDSDSNWNSFFIDTPKEFKKYRLRTVGIMLTCYDMKSSATELKSNALFKKMSKAKKVVIQRGWQKALDPDGNKCWMCIFIDAEYAKEHGRELLEEKVSYQGEDYIVIDIQDNLAILEGTDRIRVISTGTLLDL